MVDASRASMAPNPHYPTETFDKVIAVNIRGVWLGLKHVMPATQENGGSVVVTASAAGLRAILNMSRLLPPSTPLSA